MKKEYKIAVVGQGYVGLPLALAFAEKYLTSGFDIKKKRITELEKAIDSNEEIAKNVIQKSSVKFTDSLKDISSYNVFIITVPTPINNENIPDISILLEATKMIASILKKGDIVIYESTVYPGVTEDECVPFLEKYSKLKYNQDFFCGYSPERISPGDKNGRLREIVKLTSGSTKEIASEIDSLYNSIINAGTFKTESIKIAEAAKVLENTQRDVNIALINEIAMMFDAMNINTSEVLEAASTKWNFFDFKPGLVGGHCIGVDPYYLTYKSEKIGFKPNLILSSRKINNSIPSFLVQKTIELLTENNKPIKDSEILILGYTFKENCKDIRNTQVEKIIQGLKNHKCNIQIYDPFFDTHNNSIKNPFNKDCKKLYDAIIVAVAHKQFLNYSKIDFKQISNGKLVLLDVKGILSDSTWQF